MDKDLERMASKLLKKLTLEDKAKLLSQIVWETSNIEELHPDLKQFLLADGPAGIRRLKEYFDEDIYNTKPSTCYPSASTYASSWNRDLIRELGEHIGIEALQEDVDTMLAPAVNIKRSPLGGRNFEYYSEDPYVTSELATEFIQGIQKKGIGACLKHFAVNNQETRRMNINVIVDEATLHELYLKAFEKPIRIGKPKMIMTAYNQINGEFCASNKKLLTILRNDWQYEGVVVTDCFAAHDLAQGIKSGLTLQMPGESADRITARIAKLIENEELSESDLDAAVKRNIYFALEAQQHHIKRAVYDREAHHEFAKKVAEESIVLLKNSEATLPLKRNQSVLVTGELAIHPRFQGGGSSHVNPYRLEIPLEQLKSYSDRIEFTMGYQNNSGSASAKMRAEAVSEAKNYDTVIVFAGLPDLVESEGYDRQSLNLPKEQNQLIEELAKVHKRVIVILANGSVIEMPWEDSVQAIVESYLSGEAGASAIAEILYGKVNPSGKLAETFPLRLSDTPTYLNFPGNNEEVIYGEGQFIGYKYYDAMNKKVAFPFGHGLSYTKFLYEKKELYIHGKNKSVSIELENIGEFDGSEVIQVYSQQKIQHGTPSPKKLIGFKKIFIKTGEKRKIDIPLDERMFKKYHIDTHCWETCNGDYKILVGSSVEDIRLIWNIEIKQGITKITPNSNFGDMISNNLYDVLCQKLKSHPKSLSFLEMTRDDDPLKAISMGSLMTLNTLKRVDETLQDSDIENLIADINKNY